MKRYHRFRRPSKPALFAILIGASAIYLLLPRDFLRPARQMTQLLALPQYAAKQAAERVAEPMNSLRRDSGPHDEQRKLMDRLGALENAQASLQQKAIRLEATVEELAGFRGLPNFPVEASLIPAQVIAYDAAQGRESLSLNRGGRQRVKKKDWVTSGLELAAGIEEGLRSDLAVLASQTLIGFVEEAESHTSRVVLLSDPIANKAMRVHVVQVDSGKPVADLSDRGKMADFVLQGAGKGRMWISDMDARFVKSEAIRVGDLVSSDDRDPRLPCSLVVGEIAELLPDKKNPLLYAAVVQPRCDTKQLNQVIVVDVFH